MTAARAMTAPRESTDPGRRAVSALRSFYATRNPSSLKDSVEDLRAFARFCGVQTEEDVEALLLGRGSTLEKSQGLVEKYRDHLRGAGLAWGTVNRRLAAIRMLNRLAKLLGVVAWEINVSAGDRSMRRDTRGVSKQVLRQVERMKTDSRQARRDRAIVLLADRLDLTRAHLVALDLEDYHPDPSGPCVSGVAITKKIKKALDAWVEVRGLRAGPLFTTLDDAQARLTPADLMPLLRPGSVGS